jgi:hypothetical protein
MEGGMIKKRNIEGLDWISINPTLKIYNTLCSEYNFNDINYMDFEWIEQQLNYINNLTDYQKDILYSYTKYGDELVNNYLRNTLSDHILEKTIEKIKTNTFHPLLTNNILSFNSKDELLKSIHKYVHTLSEIIMNAPKLKTPIKVFRGINSIDHILKFKSKKTIDGFLSTTLYLPSTETFMGDNCCLLEITITPETPCLFIASVSKEPGEYEILINNSAQLIVKNITVKKILDIPNISNDNILDIISNYELDEKKVLECVIQL